MTGNRGGSRPELDRCGMHRDASAGESSRGLARRDSRDARESTTAATSASTADPIDHRNRRYICRADFAIVHA